MTEIGRHCVDNTQTLQAKHKEKRLLPLLLSVAPSTFPLPENVKSNRLNEPQGRETLRIDWSPKTRPKRTNTHLGKRKVKQ